MSHKYSIIIPHKNIPHLLKRCLSSIPDSDDFQVIVVDDASNSVVEVSSLVQSFRNAELILTAEGKGAGFARNRGLERANGKWVLFADADDFFGQLAFEIINAHYDDSADIVYFASDSIYSDSMKHSPKLDKRKRVIEKYKNNDRKINEFCRYFQTEPWGKMIKRDLIEKYCVKFDETPLANDYYFSILTGYYANKIIFDNRVIYMYTEREGSLSHNYSGDEKTLFTRLKVYLQVQNFLDNHNVPYVPFYRYSLSEFLKDNNFSKIVESFWELNAISKIYVYYRYIKGKIYQYTYGVNL